MKILLGLSGGVDSTYATLKLLRQGHTVEGATLVMHEHTELSEARESAESLGIPLHVIDCTEQFEKTVKANLVNEYLSARTPNPCVICNSEIKFIYLLKYAEEYGFDAIATGHYASVCKIDDSGDVRYAIARGKDKKKDQTYMLHRLPQDILSMLILPLGDDVKTEIREKALAAGLKAAEKKESQEICFIPSGEYAEYIEGVKGIFPEGDFVLEDGTVIGRHKGLIRYTVGQRKGLGVAYGERIFVSRIDAVRNEIVLSTEGSFADTVSVTDLVFTGMSEPELAEKRRVEVKLRYLARPVAATAFFDGRGGAVLKLDAPEKAVTPGQSAVMYDGDTLLCGGFIE